MLRAVLFLFAFVRLALCLRVAWCVGACGRALLGVRELSSACVVLHACVRVVVVAACCCVSDSAAVSRDCKNTSRVVHGVMKKVVSNTSQNTSV